MKGGKIGVSQRNDDVALKQRAKTPGPERYNPSINPIKIRPPSYHMGIKAESSLKILTGTNEIVGPGKYKTEEKYSSTHIKQPKWTFNKNIRTPSASNQSKNQTYFVYSSMGKQVFSKKRTEIKTSIGKESKDKMVKGIFPAHMSFVQTKISIPYPNI